MATRPATPEDQESIYNDGQGLQFKLEFILREKADGRKNAKHKTVKKSFYVHEDSALNHMLNEAIKVLGREDSLFFCYIPRTDTYTSTTIDFSSLTYTIPKTLFKEMGLSSDKDYDIMLKEAKKKAKPEIIHISMMEAEPESGGSDKENNDEEGDEEGGRGRKRKKQKTFEPSEEEVEQNELIKKINTEWKCQDRTCRRFVCFPDRVTGQHVPVTHFHSSTWAAAIQGKHINEDGTPVDIKTPPDDELFDYQEPDAADVALVRGRTAKAKANDSNITIHLTLPDATVPVPLANNPQPPPAPLQAPQPPRPRIAPQISLELFCHRYNLGQAIHAKLQAYSVTGPHTLRHLKNNHLEAANLNPAEIADIRDAQDRWVMGEGE
ncbi:hypothetical protein B0H16DRAFT_1900261 [Mycena metata]|uniref:Uncharacterized protein n=1 Tax=Mycena metata TaxID=1033252 RepID=A0AAD7MDQ5_9AGAR|nr:hypothetical protein B0H16DRAFT_1900261 [Mycena metata]